MLVKLQNVLCYVVAAAGEDVVCMLPLDGDAQANIRPVLLRASR